MDRKKVNQKIEYVRQKWRARLDDDEWITVNGTPVPLDENGNMQGEVADKIRESHISPELRKHFDRENKKVADMMKGKVGTGKSIEMDNGQILERYSMDEMKNMILKECKEAGEMYPDQSIAILYRNGDIETFSEGDDTSKMKMSNIKGVIYDNEATSAYAGTGIKIENYNETCAGDKHTRYGTSEEEDDWRIDFE